MEAIKTMSFEVSAPARWMMVVAVVAPKWQIGFVGVSIEVGPTLAVNICGCCKY